MNEKEFLPIGSVVLLTGGTKKVMITGFCSFPNDNNHKLYDYTGCLYPEGIINSNEVCLFNNEQIDKVIFKGYENEEETDFKVELQNTILNIKLDEDHNIIDENLSEVNPETFKINETVFEQNSVN